MLADEAQTARDIVASHHRVRRRCSRSSTIPRSRRSGSTRPSRVFVARDGVARARPASCWPMARCANWSSGCCSPPAAASTCLSPFVDAVPARRFAAARGDPRCHAAALGGEHPQVHPAHPRAAARSSTLGSLTGAGRRVPAHVRAVRAEHPGLRRDPERQDHAAERAAVGDPGRPSASSRWRRPSSSTSPPATPWRCSAGSRAWRAPGEITLRRLIKEALRMRPDRLVVGEVREAEALDLLIALNSGLPGMCTHPREHGARRARQAVHPAAAGRPQHRLGLRRADGRQLRSTSSCTANCCAPAGAASPRSSHPSGTSTAGVIETSTIFAPARTACSSHRRRRPGTVAKFRAAGFDPAQMLGRRRMTAAAWGACSGSACVLMLSPLLWPARACRAARRGERSAACTIGWRRPVCTW